MPLSSLRVPLLLGVATLCLVLPGLGWGVPHANQPDRVKTWAADEILPLEGLAEMHNTLVVSKPDRNYSYPWGHYAAVAAVQAPYLGWLMLSGGLSSPSGEYPYGFADPVRGLVVLTLLGRLLSALMACGIVVAAWSLGRDLWDEGTGRLAAALTATSFLVVYYARTGNVDLPAFFWIALGVAAFGRVLAQGLTPRRAAFLGLVAGTALSVKDTAIVFFLPLGAALLWPGFTRPPHGPADWPTHARSLGVALASALGSFLIVGGVWLDPQRFVAHLNEMLFETKLMDIVGAYHPPEEPGFAGRLRLLGATLATAADVFTTPTLLAAVVGAVIAWRRSRSSLLLLLPLPVLFFLLTLPSGMVVVRYLLPFSLLVALFAAHAVMGLRTTRAARLATPLALALLAWQLLFAVDLTWRQLRDPRIPAAAWLAEHTRGGQRLEHFGPSDKLPALPAGLDTGPVAGRDDWTGELGHGPRVMAYLRAEGPDWVALIPDWTSAPGSDHSADCPEAVRAGLADGSLGYQQAAHFASPGLVPVSLRPRLDHPSVAPPVHIYARSPAAGEAGKAGEAGR